MMWESPRPGALRIDPNENRPTLIGSEWHRRVPEGDSWDRCRIVGVYDLGADFGGLELCVTPLTFGPVMTSDAESFAKSYRREDEKADDPAERITARLREIEAKASA